MREEQVELTEEQVTELNDLQKMFETVGWEIFIRHQDAALKLMRETSWDYVQNNEQLSYVKGHMDCLRSIIGYANTIDARKDSWNMRENSSDPV